jgi:hypothetical protein
MMYKAILNSIGGIEIFPVISLLLFFAVFAMMLWWTFRRDHHYLQRMANLPLEADERDNNEERT